MKLEKCPFCGGKARMCSTGSHIAADRYFVSCGVCGVETPRIARVREEAIAAWNRRAEVKNDPLTLDELRQMDGEPVWVVAHPDWGHWELSCDAEDYFEDREDAFYGMTHNDPAGRYGLHALGWLAYRHKSKEDTQ